MRRSCIHVHARSCPDLIKVRMTDLYGFSAVFLFFASAQVHNVMKETPFFDVAVGVSFLEVLVCV